MLLLLIYDLRSVYACAAAYTTVETCTKEHSSVFQLGVASTRHGSSTSGRDLWSGTAQQKRSDSGCLTLAAANGSPTPSTIARRRQDGSQESARMRVFGRSDRLRGAARNDQTPLFPALRPHVDDPVGG